MTTTPKPRGLLFWRRPVAQDVGEELAFSVEMRTRELIAAGRAPDEARADATAESRFNTLLLTLLGGAGLVLAMVGIYGVVGFFVTQRATEIGVRMALGATPGDVVRLLTWQGARPILLGGAIGVALARSAMRRLRSAVYGVSVSDPTALVAAAAVLCAAGLLATLVPARRATRIDPANTLGRA